MATPTFVEILSYRILDENGEPMTEALAMDEQAIINIEKEKVVYSVDATGPIIRPKKPRI